MCVKLSVVIPIYNTDKYLQECIDSIINQTFVNMEIILVDNKSTDNSGKICDEYIEKDSRIKVIHREEHGWVGDARNDGIEAATGEWITFVDSDDWLELDCYERVFEELDNRDVDIFCEGGCLLDYPDKRISHLTAWGNFDYFEEKELNLLRQNVIAPFSRIQRPLASPWDKLYRMEFLRKNNLKYAGDILFADDVYFNFIAFCKATRIAGCKYVGYHYRQRVNSIVNSYRPDCPNKIYHFLQRTHADIHKNGFNEGWDDAISFRVMWTFGFILKHYWFHSQNKAFYFAKRTEIKKWKNKDIYKKVIYSKANQLLTKNQMVIKQILKTPFIFPLALLTRLQNWRERANL